MGCGLAPCEVGSTYSSVARLARLPLHPRWTPASRVGAGAEGLGPQTQNAPGGMNPPGASVKKRRRRRTLPPGGPGSTIRAVELNDRVRDGNGCGLHAIATDTCAGPLKSAQGGVGLRTRSLRSRIYLLLGRSPCPPTPASDLSGPRAWRAAAEIGAGRRWACSLLCGTSCVCRRTEGQEGKEGLGACLRAGAVGCGFVRNGGSDGGAPRGSPPLRIERDGDGGEEEPVKPHGRLVRLGFTCYHASTYRLSTYSSRTALQRPEGLGVLILEGASHLDAFSGYPVPT